MLNNLRLSQFLFLDIETVPEIYRFEQLPEIKKKLFEKKVKYRINDEQTVEDLYEQAGIWAEFGKIIVISAGFFVKDDGSEFRLKSFASVNEKSILQEFSNLLNSKYFQRSDLKLCAHNGKEFDFPYIARRMIINNIPVPKQLAVFGKKPWETPFCDTMELWRFGDYKHYTSLELLTNILNIPSPKTDIEGKDVARVFYEENDLERIKKYCENDVIAVAQIILRYMGKDLLNPAAIIRK
jgi:predicted PolB exonuclease-like 3'-5' exonuclease